MDINNWFSGIHFSNNVHHHHSRSTLATLPTGRSDLSHHPTSGPTPLLTSDAWHTNVVSE